MQEKQGAPDFPDCMVDREIIICPEQCSPYIYELISTLNKDMNNKRNSINDTERIIESSISEFN
ncbi:hypothetical protein, partial [Klebsiella pneumoniae]|uniref:hypothetical protein n=1 Tax=Klebsiella pneumoniae TaxID=573 RepID=UPI0040553A52